MGVNPGAGASVQNLEWGIQIIPQIFKNTDQNYPKHAISSKKNSIYFWGGGIVTALFKEKKQ